MQQKAKMLLATIDQVPGFEIVQVLGLVQGNTVRARNIGRDIMAGFKNLVGGEIRAYTELLQTARDEATLRMIDQAEERGADAIIGVRYTTSSVVEMASELYVYGTAVKLRPILPSKS